MLKYLFIITGILIFLASCKQKKDKKEFTTWKSKGDTLAAQTFDTLRNTLLRTIAEKGFPEAISFCNTEALSLTNTYTTDIVQIRRTSDKFRNHTNSPDSLEQRILQQLRELKEKNLPLINFVVENKDEFHYFKPILIQAMCLNCHGAKETQIKPDTWDMIQKKYPNDAAFNYKDGDLRGVWHIVFTKTK